jgi:hypothetical protein
MIQRLSILLLAGTLILDGRAQGVLPPSPPEKSVAVAASAPSQDGAPRQPLAPFTLAPVPKPFPEGFRDSFGLLANGPLSKPVDSAMLAQQDQPRVTIQDVASRLVIQGVLPGQEIICNAVVMSRGSVFSVVYDNTTYRLSIRAITDREVVVGWNVNQETTRIALPTLPDPEADQKLDPINLMNEKSPSVDVGAPQAKKPTDASRKTRP